MRTDHRYNLAEDKLFLERYFVYQNTPAGAPGSPEAAPTQPSTEPEKPPTLEDAKDKIKLVKESIDAAKVKYPKAAERSEKFKALGKKLDEIDKKIQEAEKAAAEKKQELITSVNSELDAIIFEISAPAVAVPAKPATAPAPAPAAAPATASTQPPKAPDKPAKAPGLSEADKAKEKAFHEDVIKEVEKAATEGKTCSEIIKNIRTVLLKIKDKPGFKSFYDEFTNKLDKGQEQVNKYKRLGSETRGLKGLRDNVKKELTDYRKKVDEVLSAPAAAPAPAPAAAPEAAEEPKVSPEQTETPEQLTQRALDTIDWIEGMRDKLKDPKHKNIKQFPDLEKRLGTIQDKLKTILESNADKEAKVREDVIKMLDDTLKIYQEAKQVSKGKLDVSEPAQASTPEQKPESKPAESQRAPRSPEGASERIPTEPKEKLSYLLGKVMEGGRESFNKNKNEITRLIDSLNVQPGPENQVASLDLPDGFTLGHVNWPKSAGKMPNFAIFKEGETVCYMQDNGGAKPELTHARELGQNERPDFGRRVAELIKCNLMLPKALSQIKTHPTTKNIIFANPSALNDFKTALITMATMSQTDKPGWEANYGGKIVQFQRNGQSLNGVFKIQVDGKMMYFDTTKPDYIGLEQPAKNGGKEISYWDAGDFLLSPKEQAQSDRRESILKKRETVIQKEKQEEEKVRAEKKAQEEEAREIREIEEEFEKSDNARVDGLIDPQFKNLVSKSAEKSITVRAEADDKEGLALINRSTIDKLIDLKQIRTEMASITIKGAPGKSDRKGLYYPGQQTVYEVDANGKQTNNRIKFYNGDTISFEFKSPEKSDEAKLNNDKSAENSVERIEARVVFDNLARSITEFVDKFKGKIGDLDLKSLNQFKDKNKNYDPNKILTAGNWTKENIKNFKIEEVVKIMQEETKIIEEAIHKKGANPDKQVSASVPASAPFSKGIDEV